jgi:polysaccharide deacetylase family protein (PEP-CTERM system associated)
MRVHRERALLLTVDVEEWYHSRWFDVRKLTTSPPDFSGEDLDLVLRFFRNLDINATFFVLGQFAERAPHLVERIKREGHEVACHGYTHNSIFELGRQRFEIELNRAKEAIREILGCNPLGYRSPNFRVNTEAVNLLENLGFGYDSSLVPCLTIPGWYGHPTAPLSPFRPSKHDVGEEDASRKFWEVPVSVFPKVRLPGAGGWYIRNLGYWWTRALLRAQLKQGSATAYFHTWEISGNLPKLKGIPFHVPNRVGRYVRDAITNLSRDLECKVCPVGDFLASQ